MDFLDVVHTTLLSSILFPKYLRNLDGTFDPC